VLALAVGAAVVAVVFGGRVLGGCVLEKWVKCGCRLVSDALKVACMPPPPR
jgi:hypothetical protein